MRVPDSKPEFLGKYRVVRELGAGGFGAVYLCEDPLLKEQVAIKVFQIRDAALAQQATSASGDVSQILRERFLSEARILRRLSSNPNIVDVYDFAELDDGTPYYVMPYLLRSLVDEIGRDAMDAAVVADMPPDQRPRRLPPTLAGNILLQLLNALAAVHKEGLIHRDIKPANILFNKDGAVQLCDFGIAKLPDAEHSQTSSGLAMGSRNYMAPEQRESAKHVDQRADIYAFGVLAYRVYTGTIPIGRYSDPVELCPVMGRELSQLILDCLEQDKNSRPADAEKLIKQFKKAVSGCGSLKGYEEADVSGDETTATWVGAGRGESRLRKEISPLKEKIKKSLSKFSEISEDEKEELKALAAIADVPEESLDKLIHEVANELGEELRARQNLLRHLDSLIAERAEIDRHQFQALGQAALVVGWSPEELEGKLIQRGAKFSNELRRDKYKSKSGGTAVRDEKIKYKARLMVSLVVVAVFATTIVSFGFQRVDLLPKKVAGISQLIENGSEIETVQERLRELGYEVIANGKMTERTRASIKDFEKKQGMVVTGAVDKALIDKLNSVVEALRVAEQQEAARKVAAENARILNVIQTGLSALGYKVAVTGERDVATDDAARAFSETHNFPFDGLSESLGERIESQVAIHEKERQAAKERKKAEQLKREVAIQVKKIEDAKKSKNYILASDLAVQAKRKYPRNSLILGAAKAVSNESCRYLNASDNYATRNRLAALPSMAEPFKKYNYPCIDEVSKNIAVAKKIYEIENSARKLLKSNKNVEAYSAYVKIKNEYASYIDLKVMDGVMAAVMSKIRSKSSSQSIGYIELSVGAGGRR